MRPREWLDLLHSSFSGLPGIRRSLRRRSRRARRISSCPAIIELLEDRTMLSAIVVNSVADNVTSGDGVVTLREAINAANSDSTTDLGDTGSGADTIEFELGLGSHVISLDLGQLNINNDLRVAGLGADRLTVSVSELSSSRIFQVGLGATVELSGLTISDGLSAFGSGGGIVNFGTLTVASSVISGNSAGSSGGGIFSGIGTTLTIVDSEISNNIAGSGVGGGIHSFAATTTVTNSTISGNSAEEFGGGIHSTGTLTLTNSTVIDNRADDDGSGGQTGGGIFQGGFGTSGTLYNTIVAGNFTGIGSTSDDVTGIVSGSHNLIGVDTGLSGISDGDANSNMVGTAGTPIDPLLGQLQNNGGPTQTHSLLAGSPAINAGSNAQVTDLTTDQRGAGFDRIVDGTVDIGALEFGVVQNMSPTAEDDAFTTAEDVPLMGNVLDDNGNGADSDADGDVLTVNTIPMSGPSNGTLVLNADGSFIYTPYIDFSGIDNFTYEVADGNGGTAQATAAISVVSSEQQIRALIGNVRQLTSDGTLNSGQGNSLIRKLNFNNNLKATLNRLQAFINHVDDLIAEGVLTADAGQSLTDAAEILRTSLSTTAEELAGLYSVFADTDLLSERMLELSTAERGRKSNNP